ncbi:hypothetical protein HanIR_Chr12g0571911 [Helianthus annuus]|nr:hypothetical protein HanIR_Chr12g0571911 [Helianthus annuus]
MYKRKFTCVFLNVWLWLLSGLSQISFGIMYSVLFCCSHFFVFKMYRLDLGILCLS